MKNLLEETMKRATNYLENLSERSVAPSREAVARLAKLNGPFPEQGSEAEAVLAELDEFCSPATMATAGPRFFGFVIGGSLPAALAANWLAGAWDQPASFYEETPATAFLEQLALGWLIDIFRLPSECGGGFVTGATMANFAALAAARHVVLEREGWRRMVCSALHR
jgi:glutamate/tyrosine decarboxylase-like PLP-dependent enzyme